MEFAGYTADLNAVQVQYVHLWLLTITAPTGYSDTYLQSGLLLKYKLLYGADPALFIFLGLREVRGRWPHGYYSKAHPE
jgi:hypothetical protein